MLWGASEDPVCAVNADLELVWAPDDRAAAYLPFFFAELNASDALPIPVIPFGSEVLFTGPDGSAVSCTAQRLALQEETILLQFCTKPVRRSFSAGEIRALLRTQSEVTHTAITQILQAFHLLRSCFGEEHPEMQAWLDTAQDAGYAILNNVSHCDELYWYSMFDSFSKSALKVQDIYIPLKRFAEMTDRVTGSNLTLTECSLMHGMFAAVDSNRLVFALLMMFVMLHGGDPKLTEMRLDAAQKDSKIRITLTLAAGQNGAESAAHAPVFRDSSATGCEMLLNRFCETFDASLTRNAGKDAKSCTLELPAAVLTDTTVIPLASAPAYYDGGSYTLYHVLLSPLFHAKDFPENNR